jgi:hypothetical protein
LSSKRRPDEPVVILGAKSPATIAPPSPTGSTDDCSNHRHREDGRLGKRPEPAFPVGGRWARIHPHRYHCAGRHAVPPAVPRASRGTILDDRHDGCDAADAGGQPTHPPGPRRAGNGNAAPSAAVVPRVVVGGRTGGVLAAGRRAGRQQPRPMGGGDAGPCGGQRTGQRAVSAGRHHRGAPLTGPDSASASGATSAAGAAGALRCGNHAPCRRTAEVSLRHDRAEHQKRRDDQQVPGSELSHTGPQPSAATELLPALPHRVQERRAARHRGLRRDAQSASPDTS